MEKRISLFQKRKFLAIYCHHCCDLQKITWRMRSSSFHLTHNSPDQIRKCVDIGSPGIRDHVMILSWLLILYFKLSGIQHSRGCYNIQGELECLCWMSQYLWWQQYSWHYTSAEDVLQWLWLTTYFVVSSFFLFIAYSFIYLSLTTSIF